MERCGTSSSVSSQAFIGGIVMSFLGIHGQAGFLGSVIIAFIGAVMLIAVVGALAV